MADYFTRFSVLIPLSTEPAQVYALALAAKAARLQEDEAAEGDFPATLRPILEDWRFETETSRVAGEWGVWLHSDYGGVDVACAFIRHLLKRFNPSGRVSLEWSNDCSKPRPDAYGGGAAVITARRIKSITTADWLAKHAA